MRSWGSVLTGAGIISVLLVPIVVSRVPSAAWAYIPALAVLIAGVVLLAAHRQFGERS